MLSNGRPVYTYDDEPSLELIEGRQKVWDDEFINEGERHTKLFMFQPITSTNLLYHEKRPTVNILDMNSFPRFFNFLVDSVGCQLHAFGTYQQLVDFIFPEKPTSAYPLRRTPSGSPYTFGKSFRYHLTDRLKEGAQSAIVHALFSMVFVGSQEDKDANPMKIVVYTDNTFIQDICIGFKRHPNSTVEVEFKTEL